MFLNQRRNTQREEVEEEEEEQPCNELGLNLGNYKKQERRT